MSDKHIITGVVLFLLAIGVVLFAAFGGTAKEEPVETSSPVAQFAQCLKESGATFYGAFWCPHCRAQKELFGAAEKLLPYVEWSTADGNGQLSICRDKEVKSYPTWEFSDGSRLTGERQFAELAERSGCPQPSE